MSAQKCGKCEKSVYPLEMIVACDKPWHKQCFRCTHCDNVISLKGFATIDGNPYCKPHYLELFKSKGTYKAFSGTEGQSTSYNASQGFKGIDSLKKPDSSPSSPHRAESPKGSKIEVPKSSLSESPTPKSGSKISGSGGSKLVQTEQQEEVKKADKSFLSEVEKSHNLKHAEVQDKSAPAIPAPVKTGDHSNLLKEVEKEGSHSNLKHVEEVKDKSAPVIESNVHVKKIDRKEFQKEIENPHVKLREVDEYQRDRSAPVIEEDVTIKKNDARPKILSQITSGPEKPLTKPDAQTDRSAPKIPGAPATNKCATCGKTVYDLEMLRACDRVYHKGCFRCKKCDGVISLKGFAMIDGDPYCKPHYLEIFKSKGNYSTFQAGNDGASSSYNATKGFKGY